MPRPALVLLLSFWGIANSEPFVQASEVFPRSGQSTVKVDGTIPTFHVLKDNRYVADLGIDDFRITENGREIQVPDGYWKDHFARTVKEPLHVAALIDMSSSMGNGGSGGFPAREAMFDVLKAVSRPAPGDLDAASGRFFHALYGFRLYRQDGWQTKIWRLDPAGYRSLTGLPVLESNLAADVPFRTDAVPTEVLDFLRPPPPERYDKDVFKYDTPLVRVVGLVRDRTNADFEGLARYLEEEAKKTFHDYERAGMPERWSRELIPCTFRRVVLLLTDGVETACDPKPDPTHRNENSCDTLHAVASREVRAFKGKIVIAYLNSGDPANRPFLTSMARATGGKLFQINPYDRENREAAIEQLSNYLRHEYVIDLTGRDPPPAKKRGARASGDIRLSVRGIGHKVEFVDRSRFGRLDVPYCRTEGGAPQPPPPENVRAPSGAGDRPTPSAPPEAPKKKVPVYTNENLPKLSPPDPTRPAVVIHDEIARTPVAGPQPKATPVSRVERPGSPVKSGPARPNAAATPRKGVASPGVPSANTVSANRSSVIEHPVGGLVSHRCIGCSQDRRPNGQVLPQCVGRVNPYKSDTIHHLAQAQRAESAGDRAGADAEIAEAVRYYRMARGYAVKHRFCKQEKEYPPLR